MPDIDHNVIGRPQYSMQSGKILSIRKTRELQTTMVIDNALARI